jgi:hypothetical protein
MVLQETGGDTFAWRLLTREFKLRRMQKLQGNSGVNSHPLTQYKSTCATEKPMGWLCGPRMAGKPSCRTAFRGVGSWMRERPVYAPSSAIGEVHNMVTSIHQEPAAVQG